MSTGKIIRLHLKDANVLHKFCIGSTQAISGKISEDVRVSHILSKIPVDLDQFLLKSVSLNSLKLWVTTAYYSAELLYLYPQLKGKRLKVKSKILILKDKLQKRMTPL